MEEVNVDDLPVIVNNSAVLMDTGTYKFEDITLNKAKGLLLSHQYISCVGHRDVAKLLSKLLDLEIEYNRTTTKLQKGQMMIVYSGANRLPENIHLTKTQIKNRERKLRLLTKLE